MQLYDNTARTLLPFSCVFLHFEKIKYLYFLAINGHALWAGLPSIQNVEIYNMYILVNKFIYRIINKLSIININLYKYLYKLYNVSQKSCIIQLEIHIEKTVLRY